MNKGFASGALVTLCISLAMVLAGCSDDEPRSTPSGDTVGTAASEAASTAASEPATDATPERFTQWERAPGVHEDGPKIVSYVQREHVRFAGSDEPHSCQYTAEITYSAGMDVTPYGYGLQVGTPRDQSGNCPDSGSGIGSVFFSTLEEALDGSNLLLEDLVTQRDLRTRRENGQLGEDEDILGEMLRKGNRE